MPTITTVEATWTNDMTLDEAKLRRADTTMFLGDGSANGVRGGVVRHGDTSLAVTVNGADQVTVQAGAAVIPAATGLGAYRASLSAATSATGLAARNATNPRIDLVVIQIVAGAAVVKTVDGTPSSSPTAPALPASSIELARLTVPALGGGAVTVDSTWRSYAAGLGAKLLVETAARLPGSGNQKGQEATALDTGLDYRWDGTTWVSSAPVGMTSYSPTLIGFATSSQQAYHQQTPGTNMVDVTYAGVLSTIGAIGLAVSLPFPAAREPIAYLPVGHVHALDVGTVRRSGAVLINPATLDRVQFIHDNTATLWSNTVPFAWAVGDQIAFSIRYERA
jgi:hypothetical protein